MYCHKFDGSNINANLIASKFIFVSISFFFSSSDGQWWYFLACLSIMKTKPNNQGNFSYIFIFKTPIRFILLFAEKTNHLIIFLHYDKEPEIL